MARKCGCPGCRQGLAPNTLAHFRAWTRELVLDSGGPFVLEPFQELVAEDLFSGVPEIWEVIPEGNGKTTFWAAVALYHCEHRDGAFVPIAASSRDQAGTYYRQGEGFVLNTPRLAKLFDAQPGYRRIRLKARRNVQIQIFAADEKTGDAVIPTLAVVDEGHRHRDLGLYRTWRGKVEKRGGQIAMISTAGQPGTDFEQTRARILESTPVVTRRRCFIHARSAQITIHDYAIPAKGDDDDLELVKEANPLSTITVASLRAKRATPTMTRAHWLRFTCNRSTRGDEAAISEAEWASRASDERIPAGTRIALGFDAGWTWDTTAAVPLWVRDPRSRLFGPAIVLWPPQDGTQLHPDTVKKALLDLHARTPIETVVMDMTRAEELAAWFQSELGAKVIQHNNGNAQAALDYDRFMEGMREGWIRHSGDPELTKHAMNARAHMLPDGRHRFERPSQTRQGGDQQARVIDAIVAAAMVNGELAAISAPPSQDLPPSRSEGRDANPVTAGMRERTW